MRKLSLLTCTVMLGLTAAVAMPDPCLAQNAAPAVAQPATGQSPQGEAQKFIQNLGDQAVAIVKDKSLNAAQQADKYNALLQDAFDMHTIAKFVLGNTGKTATPEQMAEFERLFDAHVIAIYSKSMALYSGESFHATSVRPESDKDNVVVSEIDHPKGTPPTAVEWRVRQDNGKLAIVDVTVEGVSQSVTQRQEYASILQRNNGNMDALLDMMRKQQAQPTQTN